MKTPKYLTGLLALALTSPAFSQTFYEITGATAFRAATITTVNALYVASGQPFRFSHNRTTEADFINADVVTFEGTITGLPGTTVVRIAANGSIEGLRAMAQPGQSGSAPTNGDAAYLKLSTAQTETAIVGGRNIENVANNSGNTERALAEMAFSDTDKAISPFASDNMVGTSPGVAVFGLVVSEGAAAVGPSAISPITNVTAAQMNSLFANGFTRASQFTGNSADDNKLIFCTGRNDGSGTRSSYLTEMGFGASNPVQQYLVISQSGNQIKAIQNVPVGGVNSPLPTGAGSLSQWATDTSNTITQLSNSLSTVWGQNVAGNGGAFSGSVLRGHLALDGDSVSVFDADGFDLFGAPQENIGLVSWISLNDAKTAVAGGATLAAFDGVSLTFTGGELTASDKEKIYNGQYTAWNNQQFYRRFTADTNTLFLYNAIAAAVPNNLATAGLRSIDMKVGRSGDGGIINPKF
jgi:hypothetical protein